MRVLGDINPRLTAPPDSSVGAEESRPLEGWERLHHSQNDISDLPLKITDERYRLECDRLREDEAWQDVKAQAPRPSSSVAATVSVAATAVEEPEVHRSGSAIDNTPVDFGSVSNDLTQEQRERAANELFASLGYTRVSPRESRQQRTGAPWTAVLVLVVVLAGTVGYGYLTMRENGVSPWRLPGVQTAIVLHQRLDAAQSKASAVVQAARDRSEQLMAAGRERWTHWRR